jgi:hypothetical protein
MSEYPITMAVYGQLLKKPIEGYWEYIAIDGKQHDYKVFTYAREPSWDSFNKSWQAADTTFRCLGNYSEVFVTNTGKPPVKPSKSLQKLNP